MAAVVQKLKLAFPKKKGHQLKKRKIETIGIFNCSDNIEKAFRGIVVPTVLIETSKSDDNNLQRKFYTIELGN